MCISIKEKEKYIKLTLGSLFAMSLGPIFGHIASSSSYHPPNTQTFILCREYYCIWKFIFAEED